ncbi:MAG: ABC transporter permease subunit [Pusillimonas sp.]
MKRHVRLTVQLGILFTLLAIWQLAVTAGGVDSRSLPPPTEVFIALAHMVADPSIMSNVWITTAQVLVAFVLVVPVGIGLGLLLGESDYWGKAFKPFFYFMSSVPKSVFLPLFILALGIGFTQKVAFGVFQALFVLVISAIAAAQSIPDAYIKMARSFGATRRQMYFQVYLPTMLPVVLEGLRLGMIFNITGVLFAEMYASRSGLGHLVSMWGMRYEMTKLFAGIAIAAILAIVINESLRWYENKLGKWRT